MRAKGWIQSICIISQKEKPLDVVPGFVWAILLAGLLLQTTWHTWQSELIAKVRPLPSPPEQSIVRFASLDDSITAAKLIMLWLQAFDNQPGISIPLKNLNYNLVIDWLELIIKLDPDGQYPLLAASRFYTYVPETGRKKQMLDFVQRKFLERPEERWQWMAHAVYVAKHRMHDMEYALGLAKSLRENTTQENVPDWARQMEIFILEDMGEFKSAQILIGGLLESGAINNPEQLRYLKKRLNELEDNTDSVLKK